jgi:phage virion morphogenesis protein
MAGASFEMDLGPMLRGLYQAATKMADTQQLAENIGEALVSGTQDRFEAGEAPDGSKWPATKRGGQILVDTARLKNSIGYEASPEMVVVGTSDVKAGTHQFGAKRGAYGTSKRGGPLPWGDIPKREFIGISEADEKEAKACCLRHLQRAFK